MFKQAIKQEAKLRLAIAGPAGSGKTYTGLSIAQSLVNGGKIAVLDTEHGSASKYADLFSFDVMEMDPPFHPDRFSKAIREAQEAGYKVVVLDSLSHAWNGTGGLLEVVDQIAARSNSRNSFAAWKEGTPIYNKLVDAILQSDVHVIATMRQKMDYVLETNDKGKQTPVKVGLAAVQRDGFEYEFDVVMNMDVNNQGVIVKTRCPELQGGVYRKPGKEVSDILAAWLTGAPRVETTDPLSDRAVKYASKEWNTSPNETREAIEHAMKSGKLADPITKESFKAFVANPQGEPQAAPEYEGGIDPRNSMPFGDK